MKQKSTFLTLFSGFSLILILLPPFAAINSLLTNFLHTASWYQPIEEYIVPWQARMVATLLIPFGIDSRISLSSDVATFYMLKNGAAIPVDLAWNCLGWQSMLLLLVSLATGLSGDYSNISRFKIIILGVVGTILVNIFRMSLIALAIFFVNSLAAHILHDYFASFIALLWLMFFWWFSFSFVLEKRQI